MNNRIIPWLILGLLPLWSFGQDQTCGLGPMELDLPSDREVEYPIVIDGYQLDDLSDPNQGVCGVRVTFFNSTIEALELTLISPNNQEVQLIGPNIQTGNPSISGSIAGDVQFIPCSETPDPDFGINFPNGVWDNSFFNVSDPIRVMKGDYQPFMGCLEDFNTGTINGTWTLRVSNISGNLFDGDQAIRNFTIIFCDQSGVFCCKADAGRLIASSNELTLCTGSDDANLSVGLGATYPSTREPDPSEYEYAFVVAENGNPTNYEGGPTRLDGPDLSAYPPGEYTVFGFSYLSSEPRPQLIDYNSTQALRDELASNRIFCGDLTTDSINISIIGIDPGPTQTITCAPNQQVVTIGGTNTSSGTGIDYQWNILNGNIVSDSDQIQAMVDQAGEYTLTIEKDNMVCIDTITVLENKLAPVAIIEEPDIIRCNPQSITIDASMSIVDNVGGFQARWIEPMPGVITSGRNSLTPTVNLFGAGEYTLLLTNIQSQCADTTTVVVQDSIVGVDVNIANQDLIINCSNNPLILDATGSSTGPDIEYRWTVLDGTGAFPDGDTRKTGLTIPITAPGLYNLQVFDLFTRCNRSEQFSVDIDFTEPTAEAGPDQILDCGQTTVTLDGSTSLPAGELVYSWTGPPGSTILGDSTATPSVDMGGRYFLTVTHQLSQCFQIDSVDVVANSSQPIINDLIAPFDCENGGDQTLTVDAVPSNPSNTLTYTWTHDNSPIGNTPSITINQAGTYEVTVIEDGICTADTSIIITNDFQIPIADAGPQQAVDCNTTNIQLGGAGTNSGPNISYQWFTTTGNIISDTANATISVDAGGVYGLVTTNASNNCADTSFVTVLSNNLPPLRDTILDQVIPCSTNSLTIDLRNSLVGTNLQFDWAGPDISGIDPDTAAIITVTRPGTYFLSIQDPNTGCSNSEAFQVVPDFNLPSANITQDLIDDCVTTSITLDATASRGGIAQWFLNGEALTLNTLTPTISEPGVYRLEILNEISGCISTDSVLVNVNCKPSISLTSNAATITCANPTVDLAVDITPTGPAYEFEWTATNGCFIGATDNSTVTVSCADDYQLIVTNPTLQLSDTLTIPVTENTIQPNATIGPPATITCNDPGISLDALGSSTGPTITYNWLDENAVTIGTDFTTQVSSSGTYFLIVTDSSNGCFSESSTAVAEDFSIPTITFDSTFFPCGRDTFQVNAILDPASDDYTFAWSGQGIVGANDNFSILTNGPGTYNLIVTNTQNGCSETATLNLQASTCPPCLTLMEPDTITCNTATITLESSFCEDCTGCTINWSSPNGTIVSGGNTLNPVVSEAGTYELLVTAPNGLTARESVTILANLRAPLIRLAEPPNITCGTPEITINIQDNEGGPNISLEWAAINGQQFIDNGLSITTREGGFYSITSRNLSNGCFTIDTVAVDVDTISPILNIQPTTTIDCINPTAIVNATSSTFANSGTFNWTSLNGTAIAGENLPNPIIREGGTYQLTLQDTINGCSTTGSINVQANLTPPTITNIPDGQIDCNNATATLEGNTPLPFGFIFAWCEQAPDGSFINCDDVNLLKTVNTPGTYRFQLVDLNNGCSNEELVTVSDRTATPIVDAGLAQSLTCLTTEVQLNGSVPTDDNYTIQWTSPQNLPIVDPNSLTPRVDEPGIYFMTAINDATGCSNLDSVFVTFDGSQPQLMIGNDTMISCRNPTVVLSAQVISNSDDIDFQWTTEDGNILDRANTTVPLADAPGTYVLTVLDNTNGCSITDSLVVTEQNVFPEALIENSNLAALTCRDDQVIIDGSLSVSGTGGQLSYQWAPITDGSNIVGPGNVPIIQVNQPGTYELMVEDLSNGCTDVTQVIVNSEINKPVVIVDQPEKITCQNNRIALDGSNSTSGNNFSTTWRDANGQIIGNTEIATVEESGFYRLIVENLQNGCIDSLQVFVPIDTVAPEIQITATDPLTCIATTSTINSSIRLNGNYSYDWTTTNGQIINGQSTANPTVSQPGNYDLSVFNQENGCSSTATAFVDISTDSITDVSIQTVPPSCADTRDGSILIDAVTGGDGPYLYALDSDFFFNQNEFRNLATGTYQLTVQNEDGCELETTVTLESPTELSVELGPDLTVPLGETITIKPQINGAFDDFIWSTDTISINPDNLDLEIRPFDNGLYQLEIFNSAGCRAEDDIFVRVDKTKAVYIPNAFSPESSNPANSRFTIFAKDNGTVEIVNRLSVYNRWGLLVFERENFLPNDPVLGWDGTFDSQDLNTNVFTYTAQITFIDGEVILYEGDVTLVR